jgi:hypothetical protein
LASGMDSTPGSLVADVATLSFSRGMITDSDAADGAGVGEGNSELIAGSAAPGVIFGFSLKRPGTGAATEAAPGAAAPPVPGSMGPPEGGIGDAGVAAAPRLRGRRRSGGGGCSSLMNAGYTSTPVERNKILTNRAPSTDTFYPPMNTSGES